MSIVGRARAGLRSALRAARGRLRPGNVAMFHFGRCGSTVLGDLLDQHPRILWDSELFEKVRQGQVPERERSDDAVELLRLRMQRAGRSYYGFETKILPTEHLRPELVGMNVSDYVDALERLGFSHWIFLDRRNRLRQLVSGVVGQQTRQWHQGTGERPKLSKVELALDAVQVGGGVKPMLEWFAAFDAAFEEAAARIGTAPLLRLTYEDDVAADPVATCARVCGFLGLEPPPAAEVKRSRTNPFPLRDMLVNFDEVAAALRGTPHEWMLDD